MHRDIKPENILITEDRVKIADFSWSVFLKQKKRKTFCGTLDYLSPEIAHGDEYDYKSDNWALGVLCYELLVGMTPFRSFSSHKTLMNIKNSPVSFPDFFSKSSIDFISLLLLKNAVERVELDQLLTHPFILNNI